MAAAATRQLNMMTKSTLKYLSWFVLLLLAATLIISIFFGKAASRHGIEGAYLGGASCLLFGLYLILSALAGLEVAIGPGPLISTKDKGAKITVGLIGGAVILAGIYFVADNI